MSPSSEVVASRGTYKASAIDMLRSNARIICALGPADFGGLDRVRARLLQLASAGPAARLGLHATSTSQHWDYRPEDICADVTAIDPLCQSDLASVMIDLATNPTDAPFRARLGGNYLIIDLSHGLSDAVLPVAIVAALADPSADTELPEWATVRSIRDPLPGALGGWLVRNPRKVAEILLGKFHRAAPAETSAATTETMAWTRSPALAVATSANGATTALRRWRDRHAPGISISALQCGAIARALNERGVATTDTTGFLFDCRRYLKAGTPVLGNFAVGVDFVGVDPTSPEAVHRAVNNAVEMGRPLAAGTLSTLKYLRTRSALPSSAATTMSPNPAAQLTFSDIGRIPQLEDIAWRSDNPSQCGFFTISEPTRPDSIVVTSMQIRGTFQVSVSFHDNVFDAETISSALELALTDPFTLLNPQEMSR